MIGRRSEAVLNRAVRYAMEHEQEYFTLEHVLWSLLEESDVLEAVRASGGDPIKLRDDLQEYLAREVPRAAKKTEAGEPEHPVATLSIQRMIQRALFHVQSAGKDEIQPLDLFVALFQAKESHALSLLSQQGVERLDVLNFISHGVAKNDQDTSLDSSADLEEESEEDSEMPRGPSGRQYRPVGEQDALKQYAQNLNERAKDGKIDPLIGRVNELDRIVQTLCRRRKNNPILVGEAGVGKTALAEGLALRIVEGNVPELLKNAVVYSLDLGSLVAGAKFRGDFEQRLKKVLKSLEVKQERGELPVLFIDEIHTLIGAGAVSGGAMDAANLLKPMLSNGDLRCIGSTTYQEYRSVFEKDHALARRFQKVDVVEPTVEEAVQILQGLKVKFEAHHNVVYTSEAIRSAVELSQKHLTDRHLPDKAIDVIDEVGAKYRLTRKSPSDGETQEPLVIDKGAVEDIIAQIARIPARSVSTNQKERLKNLERDLKLTLFGQDQAIDAIVAAIRLARSGLRSGDRPVGSFLFAGPTGVGKTELSKQLAKSLGVPFLRYDMSEYSERHTISRLIGAPPGYVGFEQAGLLTDAILKAPYAVVLLDEIEKAHSEIWNILLQIMDHGTLTDNNGRKADFRNAILLMTSNVGARELERRPVGMGPTGVDPSGGARRELERTFSPEFRNRLDAIIQFNSLDPITIGQVVGKNILELETQLLAKGVEIELDAEVREWLAQKGYDRLMGARPMARLIQDRIKKPLAEELLFGKLEHGGKVIVTMKDAEPQFEFVSNPKKDEDPDSESPLEATRISSEL